mmetsp:Transcript_15729/g.39576  ORF Transcript_15729/g.39576 Transcript_15729/m.39576 type:complete len:85 (+) Transcript_15729:1604-1858(+)
MRITIIAIARKNMNATAKKNLNKTNNSMLIDFHSTRWLNAIGLNDAKIMQSSVLYREHNKIRGFLSSHQRHNTNSDILSKSVHL